MSPCGTPPSPESPGVVGGAWGCATSSTSYVWLLPTAFPVGLAPVPPSTQPGVPVPGGIFQLVQSPRDGGVELMNPPGKHYYPSGE